MKWTLKDYLNRHELTPYQLAKATGLSVNTVYPLARGEAKGIQLETLQTVLNALDKLTGEQVELNDLLEREATAQDDADLAEAGLADFAAALEEIDSDVPPEELAAWDAAFEQASRPNR